jgi:hypothetical protein
MNKNTASLKKNLPYIIIVVLFFGLVFAGYEILKPKKTSNVQVSTQNNQGFGSNGGGNGGASSGGSGRRGNFTPPTTGTISNINGNTITMTASDNSTKTITCSDTTRISENTNGQMTQLSLTDLSNGETINVMGTASGDNITARMIFIGDMPARGNWRGGGNSNGNSGGSGTSTDNSNGSI